MNQLSFAHDILFLQRFLKCCELYSGPLDGKRNSDVSRGEDAFATQYQSIKNAMGHFDDRSEACIMTLQPVAQQKAREFLKATKSLPFTYRIIEGTRTYKGTKYGISAASYPDLDIANLTLGQAEGIYEADYWKKAGCPDFPPRLAFHVFDAAVNNGVGNAVRWLQRAVGAKGKVRQFGGRGEQGAHRRQLDVGPLE